jgi:hypothetical protein
MSEATFTRVKTAILTAADESQPDEVREVARDVVHRIDAGEPIRAQVERIREARETSGSRKNRATWVGGQ